MTPKTDSSIPFSCLLSPRLGDAIPKRPFLKHGEYLTYSLFVPACALTWLRRVDFVSDWRISLALGLIVGAVVTYGVAKFGAFTIFKLYPEGYGAGFNLYWKGWRVVGLDWHQWVIRQDLKTRKPLPPDQQYALNRPHIDLPLWEYHHWPWTQLPHSSEAATKKAAKDVVRAAAAEKKAERKARRAAVLAERATKGDDATASPSPVENSETESSLPAALLAEDGDLSPFENAPSASNEVKPSVEASTDSKSDSKTEIASELPKIFESTETASRKKHDVEPSLASDAKTTQEAGSTDPDSREAATPMVEAQE